MWAWIYEKSGLINIDRTDRIWIRHKPEDPCYYLKVSQNGTEHIIKTFNDYDSAIRYLRNITAGLRCESAVMPEEYS